MISFSIEGSAPRFIVFHGTGGDEHDLVPLVRTIAPDSGIRSYRGISEENGMLRWFPRHGPNVFIESEVRDHIEQVMDGLREDFSSEELEASIFLGYSNGANAIAAMLQLGLVIKRAVLLHPMLVLPDTIDLNGVEVFVSIGERDAMIPPFESEKLVGFFEEAGAVVTLVRLPGGHGIGREEVDALARWLKARSDPR